ncbi:MAG: hypothetical protein V3T99_05535, partial [Nitrososphaerales archaeon]
MASLEERLKVTGWQSEFRSVEQFLNHYGRKTKSEHTRMNVLGTLKSFVDFVGIENLDKYVGFAKTKVEGDFQRFLD